MNWPGHLYSYVAAASKSSDGSFHRSQFSHLHIWYNSQRPPTAIVRKQVRCGWLGGLVDGWKKRERAQKGRGRQRL